MSEVRIAGCLINLVASDHPHFRSIVEEGLWGFSERYRGRWSSLKRGTRALLYFKHRGVKGVWGVAEVIEVFEDRRPVEFWVRDPSGYPLRVKLKLLQPVEHTPAPSAPLRLKVFDGVRPLRKEELAALGVRKLKLAADLEFSHRIGEVITEGEGLRIELSKHFMKPNSASGSSRSVM